MKKETKILIQYTRAGFSKRMHLFLQFPDLRNVFQDIERKRCFCSKDLSMCYRTA